MAPRGRFRGRHGRSGRRRLQGLIEKYGFRRQRDALGLQQQRIDDFVARLAAAAGAASPRPRPSAGLKQRYGPARVAARDRRRRQQAAAARARLGGGAASSA